MSSDLIAQLRQYAKEYYDYGGNKNQDGDLLVEAADALETAYHNIHMGGKVEEAQARRIEALEAGLWASQEFEQAADAYSEDSTLTNAEAYDRAKHRLWKARALLAPEPKPQEVES